MRRALQVGIVAFGALYAAPGGAVEQEGVILPLLDDYDDQLRSLLAQDAGKDVDAIVGGGLGVGPRRSTEFSGPFTTLGLFARAGAYGAPAVRANARSELSARFSLASFVDDTPQAFDIAGRHRFALELGTMAPDGFSFQVAPFQSFDHASSGSWGERHVDVAPEPYVDFRGGASVWLNHGDNGGTGSASLKAIEITYDARSTAYLGRALEGPHRERSRVVHHVGLGAGAREINANKFQLDAIFFRPNYVTTYATLTPTRWHRFDYHFVDVSARGAEVDELGGMIEARLGGSAFFNHDGGDPIHTGDMRVAVRFDAPRLLDMGLAVSHAPGFDPAGHRPLGITSFELHALLEPEPHHYGALVRGRIDRVVDLSSDYSDAWRGHATGELYARVAGATFGGATRLSYGDATGSMGWTPFVGEHRWSAYVGGFVRAEACLSSRCGTRVTPPQ